MTAFSLSLFSSLLLSSLAPHVLTPLMSRHLRRFLVARLKMLSATLVYGLLWSSTISEALKCEDDNPKCHVLGLTKRRSWRERWVGVSVAAFAGIAVS